MPVPPAKPLRPRARHRRPHTHQNAKDSPSGAQHHPPNAARKHVAAVTLEQDRHERLSAIASSMPGEPIGMTGPRGRPRAGAREEGGIRRGACSTMASPSTKRWELARRSGHRPRAPG